MPFKILIEKRKLQIVFLDLFSSSDHVHYQYHAIFVLDFCMRVCVHMCATLCGGGKKKYCCFMLASSILFMTVKSAQPLMIAC